MTVLALCVIRGNSNFTQYRLSTSNLRNALIVLVLTQSFYSQLLSLLAFLLLLSLHIPYSVFPLFLLLFLSALLLLLSVLLLLFFSQHFLRLLSLSPELQPLLAPLLFSEPLSLPGFDFLILF